MIVRFSCRESHGEIVQAAVPFGRVVMVIEHERLTAELDGEQRAAYVVVDGGAEGGRYLTREGFEDMAQRLEEASGVATLSVDDGPVRAVLGELVEWVHEDGS